MFNSAIRLLDDTTEKFKDNTALTGPKGSYTYGALSSRAKSIATLILDRQNDKINEPVIVYLPKCNEAVISFMGILYSANYYVPLNVSMPMPKLMRVMDLLSPAMIITDEARAKLLADAGVCESMLVIYDEIPDVQPDESRIYRAVDSVIDIDPAYVMYTSGSTGDPKGVVIPHRGVIDLAQWMLDIFEMDDKTIMGNQAQFSFDSTVLEIYSSIACGGNLVILPDNLFKFPSKLLEYMEEIKVNFVFWVPTVLINIANSGALDGFTFKHLKKVLFCGEVMPNRQLNIWRKSNPNLLYVNLYGPTEASVVCTYYIVEREFADSDSLPIGKACRNMRMIILSDDNRVAKTGEKGELCIIGTGLANSYYNAPDVSQKAFIQNPNNKSYNETLYRTGDLAYENEEGILIILGRKDSQIKYRGNRIELNEIELAAKSVPGVFNACVQYDGDNEIIYMYVESERGLEPKAVTKEMKKLLQSYMIPKIIKMMDRLPLNPNKKVDRVAIRKLYEEANG